MQSNQQQLVTRSRLAMALMTACLFTSAQAAVVDSPGWVKGEVYTEIGGTAVQGLLDDPGFAEPPDRVIYFKSVDYPDNFFGENYGINISGYIVAPETGEFDFFTRSDDASQLYLNTAGATPPVPDGGSYIASEGGCCNSFLEPGASQTTAAPIPLVAGQKYGFTFLIKEGGGGDWGQIAIRKVGDPTPAGLLKPLSGGLIGTPVDSAGASVTITTHPQNTTVAEQNTLVLTGAATGTMAVEPLAPGPAYQWYRNNQVIPGATNSTFTLPLVKKASNNGAVYTLQASVPGAVATSQGATITVTDDVTAPSVASASGNSGLNQVTLVFSEPINTNGVAAGNFSIQGLTISGIRIANDTTIILNTGLQTPSTSYNVAVSNIRDLVGNTIASGATAPFTAWVTVPGLVYHRFWQRAGGGNIADLRDPAFGDIPTKTEFLPALEFPLNGAGEGGANYINELSGWITPPTTGDYVFFVSADDGAELYLSTDADPAKAVLIAREPTWNNPRQWVATSRRNADAPENRSDTFIDTAWPTGNTITLTAGQRYAYRVIHAEGGGGDNVGINWKLPGADDPANGAAALSGSVLSVLADPNTFSVTITAQPAASTTIVAGNSTTLTVGFTAAGSVGSVQWQRAAPGGAFADIAGATSASYNTGDLTTAATGTRYRAIVTSGPKTATTSEAVVTVLGDAFGPDALGAGALRQDTGDTQVTVLFNEALKPSTITSGAFTLSAGTITGTRYITNASGLDRKDTAVALTVTGLTAGQSGTVTVGATLEDVFGNKSVAETLPFQVSTLTWASIGAIGATAQPNAVVALSTNDFNLVSGSQSYWNVTDDLVYLYEEITGDFDRTVHVEYVDPATQWSRSALTLRESLLGGTENSAEAPRGYSVITEPGAVPTLSNSSGNNSFEVHVRNAMGAAIVGGGGGQGPIVYPNVWLRLTRVGAVLTPRISKDGGTTWISLGAATDSATWADGPLADKVYMGMSYGPDLAGLDVSVTTRFRDYGPFTVAVARPTLAITQAGGNITITWQGAGTLEATDSLSGTPTWTAVTGVTGTSYTTAASAAKRFYRVRAQ